MNTNQSDIHEPEWGGAAAHMSMSGDHHHRDAAGETRASSEAKLSPQASEVRSKLAETTRAGGVAGEGGRWAAARGLTVRPSGTKDRHSKVRTAKGLRDRRVRLSAPTAIQFFDVQDRLGYDQPSKAVDWLITKARAAIDELPPLASLQTQSYPGPERCNDIIRATSDGQQQQQDDMDIDMEIQVVQMNNTTTRSASCSSSIKAEDEDEQSMSTQRAASGWRAESRAKARVRAKERTLKLESRTTVQSDTCAAANNYTDINFHLQDVTQLPWHQLPTGRSSSVLTINAAPTSRLFPVTSGGNVTSPAAAAAVAAASFNNNSISPRGTLQSILCTSVNPILAQQTVTNTNTNSHSPKICYGNIIAAASSHHHRDVHPPEQYPASTAIDYSGHNMIHGVAYQFQPQAQAQQDSRVHPNQPSMAMPADFH